jgi:hypothetical protein
MNALLNKPTLWTYGESAKIFGLSFDDGYRTIRTLVRLHNLTPKAMDNGRSKGLSRSDLEILAKALNKTLDQPNSQAD